MTGGGATPAQGHDHDHELGHGERGHADDPHRDNGHDHDHDHGHGHEHGGGLWGRLREAFVPHSHDSLDQVDSALETSKQGLRALWISFAGLMATAVLQAIVVAFSSSVALLADTLHNLADSLTAVPLAIAFTLGRRAANRRYTYGYGRSEDLAGLVVVLVILASAIVAAWTAIQRLLHPTTVGALGWVAAASIVGFAGNELVARYRIVVGRRIGSAALVADGLHARADGLTSLAVLIGVAGVALGWRQADPIIGLGITVAILGVLWQAVRVVVARMMDAVDPELLDRVEDVLRGTDGVVGLGDVKLRWIGHALRAECEVILDDTLDLVRAHEITHDAEHRLLHGIPRLTTALVHAEPRSVDGVDRHAALAHHRPPS